MTIVSEVVEKAVKSMFPDMEPLSINHATVLMYFGEKRVKRLSFHRDCIYKPDGTFDSKLNSQVPDTPTCILSIGDRRDVQFKLFKHTRGENGYLKLKTCGERDRKKFTLKHGSLFILHYDDEKLQLREFYQHEGEMKKLMNEQCFYKHGNVRFGGNGMVSVGIVFRCTSKSLLVHASSGKHVCYEKSESGIQHERLIDDYLGSFKREQDEDMFLSLFQHLSETYEI